MNYQDTSSLTGTDARSDADVIPAGSNAPAVGNTITGTGTVSGAAGADVVGSAPGHVVAVQGAGGGDTSASGEAMQVSGRYGVLNMQADGDYRYTRNGDTPDGVRDVFTYTLADAGESRDTATLTIDIGREPTVVQANAQQVVPGPDGVITLPAGVTMANVHVVGRNLVIDMPDGTQMVIVDGAVFVPQLVLGGVEIPASTVASLLVDSEPPIAPTAGTPPSGGGNFGLPPGPLDPGVPLGDLIPPVEADYEPPVFEDVGQFIDDEPEIFIQPDGQPASVAAVDQVDERGLPSRNEGEPAGSGEISDGNGANNSDTRETTTGTIIIDAKDTPTEITITVNGITTVITGTVPQVIQGQYGALTITSVSDTAIDYSYTLRDNTSGDATHDDFIVTLTDNDGDQASATLRIDIIDDVPTANADVDSVTEDGPSVATGNVRTGGTDAGDANTTDGVADVTGADNATLTAFNGAGGNGTFGVSLAGTYGSIVLNANGSYTYTLNNANAAVQGLDTGETLIETYNYTITDGDGDTSTTTLRITINGANDAPVALDDTNWTVEDGGNITGNVLVNTPHNGAPDDQPRADVADTDVDIEPLTVTQVNGGSIAAPIAGAYGSLTMGANGAYTYDLNDALPAVQALGVGETLIETFTYTSSDGTATDGAVLTITIFGTNDAPVAIDDTNWGLEDGPNVVGNVLNNVAHNGAPDEQARADVADTDVDGDTLTVSLNGPAAGAYGTITLNPDGSYSYNIDDSLSVVQALGVGETLIETYTYTSSDGNGGTDTATLTITIFGTNDLPVAIDDTNWTVEDGGTIAGNVLNNLAHNGAPDGAPRADVADTDVDGDDLDVAIVGSLVGSYGTLTLNAETGAYTYALNNALPAVQALGVGETLIETYTYTANDGNGGTDNATLTITIFGTNDAPVAIDDTNWTQEDGGTISGNVLNNVAHNGAPDGAPRADVADTDVDGDDLDVAIVGSLTGTYGVLTLNAETGAYTYALNNALPAIQGLDTGETLIETYTYTSSDGNGGTDTATLTITIFGTNDAPVALNDTNWTIEDGGTISGNVLINLAHNGAPDGAPRADVADTDVDGEDLDVAIIGSLVGSYGTLTLDAETGAYTYDLNDALPAVQALTPGQTLIETFQYNATDGTATDGATLTITIFGTNDGPNAINDTNWTQEDGGTISGNVLNNVAHNGAPDGAPRADVADTDPDGDDLDVAIIGSLVGTYGTLTLDAETGAYTYDLNDALPAVQALDTGETLIETFQYNASDGVGSDGATLTITIFGTNDAPVAQNDTNWTIEDGGTISGNVLVNTAHNGAPDGAPRADVADTDVDVEDLDVSIIGSLVGTYGTLTLDAETGAYTYDLNDALPAVQALDVGETLIEVFQYNASDGTASDGATLTITIFGANDPPTIQPSSVTISDEGVTGGNPDAVGVPSDDTNLASAGGTMTVADVDGEALTVTFTSYPTGLSVDGNALTWSGLGTNTITGSFNGTTYLTLTINNSGAYTVTLQNHGLDHAPGGGEQEFNFTANVQVSDGTTTNSAVLTVTIEDDSPTISGTNTTTLNIDNNANPYNEGTFVMSVGGDKNFDNNDIALSGFTVAVNGSDVPATITGEVENAVSVTYTFEFTYDTGNGGEVTETGTMIFYKSGPDAGTYTVEIDNPIAGFSTLETAGGSAFVGYQFDSSATDNTQPAVAVTTIVEESAPGENDGFYVQFTGFSAGNGDHETIGDATIDEWEEGELFSEGTSLHQSWVSVSNASNGVAGDTVNGPDVLNFNLYSSNPTGSFTEQEGDLPTASASDMFLVFDGIGSSDDFIVVLKLWNDTNGTEGIQADDSFTTVSIVVSADDIYRFDATNEANTVTALAGSAYESVVNDIVALGGSNNNDGLVIIESNDYDPDGEGWQIVGAQIVNTNAGVDGTGTDLNSDIGDDGGSEDPQAFSTVDDTAPMKITNIGFLTGTSEDQEATIEFTLTVTDSDGDSVTQDYTVNVGDYPGDTTEPAAALSAMVVSQEADTSSFSLLSYESQDLQMQKSYFNGNGALYGAVAAAGLMSASSVAAAPTFGYASTGYGDFNQSFLMSSTSLQSFNTESIAPMFDSTAMISWENQNFANDGATFQQTTFTSEGLAPASIDLPALSQLAQGYDMPVNMEAAYGSTFAAADVVIPSLEALVASFAQNGGATALSGVVAEVLSDALAGGGEGLNIDSLLDGLPGLGGTGMEALASHGMTGVPAWDMGAFGGFTGIHQAFTMETLVLHQDGVMPQA